MADAPTNDEPIFDPDTGQFTVRYQAFFNSLQTETNESSSNIESEVSAALTELGNARAQISDLRKDIEELQMIPTTNRANIGVLETRIKEVEALV